MLLVRGNLMLWLELRVSLSHNMWILSEGALLVFHIKLTVVEHREIRRATDLVNCPAGYVLHQPRLESRCLSLLLLIH